MDEKAVFLLINGILVILLIITLIREYLHAKFKLNSGQIETDDDSFQPNLAFNVNQNPFCIKESSNGKMTTDAARQILGVHAMSNEQQVKMAYHELIKKYHPDHVSFLGSEFQQMAENKTRNINLAYHVVMRQLENNQKKIQAVFDEIRLKNP